MAITIKTGDILKWASKMEEKGADFAAEVVKKAKGEHEKKRKEKKMKFTRIRRKQTGKRFAIVKDVNRAAELIKRTQTGRFTDIFKD